MNFLNTGAYKFCDLSEAEQTQWQQALESMASALKIKGTILISHEGINLFVAGTFSAIDKFKNYLENESPFQGLTYKDSVSDRIPYKRLRVKIKQEIISMGCEEIKPAEKTAPHLSPEEFKRWYDDGREMLVLDTRNDYEVRLGSFDQAVDLDLEHFRDFPERVKSLVKEHADKPIVTFCTGGIRCEKAAEYMLQQGFKKVYQLDGGIINYFAKCKGAHYHGECFTFDERVALDPDLNETDTIACFACGMPLTKHEQLDSGICPHCQKSREGKRAASYPNRQQPHQ
ncbi:MAG: sulfurtransferase [Gammaproteobacteria bacterium]|nr:sulfurtransferase [Gammaproteobacteria bacterium]